jgi:LytS/YehU family sensor histidine kinase
MLGKIANWYRGWEDETLAVLAQPELAARMPKGRRRCNAQVLADMPPLQRAQLRAFLLKYRGARCYCALAGLALVFSFGGALLHLAAPGVSWLQAILTVNLFGFLIAAALVSAWFDYRRLTQKKGKLILAVVAFGGFGALVSIALATAMDGQPLAAKLERVSHVLSGMMAGSLVIAVPVLAISLWRNRQYETINAQLQREAEQAKLARELSESQLRLLRAQIEPHFLFNTLGAVQQLAQQGAPRAAELTGNLIDFLRSSMRDMRSDQVSMAAEFGLVESYLKVMQVRLGERLRYSLQLPRALEQVQLPTMILLTLVENAIKHGIEPALRGGEVTVSAQAEEGTLRIRVQDGGVGMSTIAEPDGGGGTGLDNVRHRLLLAYGEQAGLHLLDGDPGLIADITIPYPANA